MIKTITLDFETYERELKDAKLEGTQLKPEILDAIDDLIKICSGSSRSDFEKARVRLYQLTDAYRKRRP